MNAMVEFPWPATTGDWRQAVNDWLAAHPSGVCDIAGRAVAFEWTADRHRTMRIHALFECQGYQWAIGLDSLRVLDERLVGEPFMSMPAPLRTLVVEKLLADAFDSLPPGMGRNIDAPRIVWDAPAWPDSWLTLPFSLRNPDRQTISHGIFAIEEAAGLAWLNENLPAWEREKKQMPRTRLQYGVPLTIGASALTAEQIRGLEAGDLIWVETAGIARQGLQVWLTVDAGPSPIAFRGYLKHRQLTLCEESPARPLVNSERSMQIDIDQLELPVTFDLGEIKMSLAELERLGEQHILELPHEAADARVNVRVHGACVAQGRLMVVGRRLAVRLEKAGMADVSAAQPDAVLSSQG